MASFEQCRQGGEQHAKERREKGRTEPTSDRCVACAPDTYSVEEAVFGEKLWDHSVENYNKYCHACARSRARFCDTLHAYIHTCMHA
jgi:hypothetical protein